MLLPQCPHGVDVGNFFTFEVNVRIILVVCNGNVTIGDSSYFMMSEVFSN